MWRASVRPAGAASGSEPILILCIECHHILRLINSTYPNPQAGVFLVISLSVAMLLHQARLAAERATSTASS